MEEKNNLPGARAETVVLRVRVPHVECPVIGLCERLGSKSLGRVSNISRSRKDFPPKIFITPNKWKLIFKKSKEKKN